MKANVLNRAFHMQNAKDGCQCNFDNVYSKPICCLWFVLIYALLVKRLLTTNNLVDG